MWPKSDNLELPQDGLFRGGHGLSQEYRTLGPPLYRPESARLDSYLAEHFPFLTRAGWQKRIDNGELRINGRIVRAAYKVKHGDAIYFFQPFAKEPEVDRGIYTIWEEGPLMAVFKPGNLPMHEGGPYHKNTFANELREQIGPEWAALHRLDRETSGIVLCAKGSDIRKIMSEEFAAGMMTKEYLAIASGVAEQSAWEVNAPLGVPEQSAIRIKKWVDPKGLPSVTLYEVVEQAPAHVLLRARPKTGRTNQIRIHAAYSGHVLVGDKLYHPNEQVFLDYFAEGNTPEVQAATGHHRHCLHAASLAFDHPTTGKTVTVTCPMPTDMQELWEKLKSPTAH